jgi:hypothetical protein
MSTVWIQLGLIVATLLVSARLLSSQGQRVLALRRLGLAAFAGFAVASILFPNLWARLAHMVGIGRGTDLILYALVVAFFGFVASSFRRFRELEVRYTRLARRIALDEAPPPVPAGPRDTGPTPEREP